MKLTFLISALLCSTISIAQIVEKDLSAGFSMIIESEILEDQRELQIFFPDDYEASDADYPVLYILDGQRYFWHGISLQKSFVNFKQTPGFIVVGIPQNRSDRNRIYNQNSQKYLSFIENEVIKVVDERFRTTKDRMIFGWASGGGFVLHVLISKPYLFDAYIAASPFPVENKIESLDSMLSGNSLDDKLLFFGAETNDGAVKEESNRLDSLLIKKATNSMNWTFKELEGEEHRSTAFTTLYHGIQKYYQYFPELQFNNLEEFRKTGGLPYAYNYYHNRSIKFGFQSGLSDWTMFSLTRNAMREHDLDQFEIFVDEFIESDFLSRINLNRSSSIANFYRENDKHLQAIKIFQSLAEKHPNSEIPLNGLGDTYKAMNDEENALLYYRKAKEVHNN